MIGFDKLEDGTWYDGFVWHQGKQRGVETMKWVGDTFVKEDVRMPLVYFHVDDPKNRNPNAVCFEPNVVSIGEPAS